MLCETYQTGRILAEASFPNPKITLHYCSLLESLSPSQSKNSRLFMLCQYQEVNQSLPNHWEALEVSQRSCYIRTQCDHGLCWVCVATPLPTTEEINAYRSGLVYNGRFKAWLAKRIDLMRDINGQPQRKIPNSTSTNNLSAEWNYRPEV
jgi:hypothetical protein